GAAAVESPRGESGTEVVEAGRRERGVAAGPSPGDLVLETARRAAQEIHRPGVDRGAAAGRDVLERGSGGEVVEAVTVEVRDRQRIAVCVPGLGVGRHRVVLRHEASPLGGKPETGAVEDRHRTGFGERTDAL